MNLEITKERVLEASKQSNEVKAALETLFPDAFELEAIKIEDFEVNEFTDKLVFIGKAYAPTGLSGKCLMLNNKYNWEVRTAYGHMTLIPTHKF